MLSALLLASGLLAPVASQDPVPQADIDAAIEKGVEFLLSEQQADGSWHFQGAPRAGAAALALYALLSSDVDPGHEAVQRGFKHLARGTPPGTYDVSLLILALAAHGAAEHYDWIVELVELLLEWQTGLGDWGYPAGSDLSNTQFAALGLRAGALAGVEVPVEAWTRLMKAMDRYDAGAGWYSYNRSGGKNSDSMTAAGVGTLAICDDMLTRAGELTGGRAASLREAREKGVARLERSLTGGSFNYYYLYGVERVGAFTGLATFGDVDWYEAGARFLVRTQAANGAWSSGARARGWGTPQTSFALLFLRRASARAAISGRREANRPHSFGTKDASADVQVIATGQSPLTLFVSGWGREAMKELEWPGERGKGPRVARVAYVANGRVIAEVEGDPGRPAELERFAVRHHFRADGSYEIQARVHVIGPPAESPGGRELAGNVRLLESPLFPVTINALVPPWVTEQREDRRHNLVLHADPRATASSSFDGDAGLLPGGHPPSNAVDGRSRSAWLADPRDGRPRLTVSLKKPPLADTIIVSHATSTPYRAGFFARALEVVVRINGGEEQTLRMHSDERHKARLALPAPVRVRRLELEIPWTVPGEHPAVGIAEVELQLVDPSARSGR